MHRKRVLGFVILALVMAGVCAAAPPITPPAGAQPVVLQVVAMGEVYQAMTVVAVLTGIPLLGVAVGLVVVLKTMKTLSFQMAKIPEDPPRGRPRSKPKPDAAGSAAGSPAPTTPSTS